MKKYLFGIVALVFAIGLSSFTGETSKKANPKNLNVKYFRIINHDYLQGQAVLKADAEYISDTDPGSSGSGCTGSDLQCISTFDASTQVDSNNELIGTSQTPVASPYKKANP
jgi:hypothetical protein